MVVEGSHFFPEDGRGPGRGTTAAPGRRVGGTSRAAATGMRITTASAAGSARGTGSGIGTASAIGTVRGSTATASTGVYADLLSPASFVIDRLCPTGKGGCSLGAAAGHCAVFLGWQQVGQHGE